MYVFEPEQLRLNDTHVPPTISGYWDSFKHYTSIEQCPSSERPQAFNFIAMPQTLPDDVPSGIVSSQQRPRLIRSNSSAVKVPSAPLTKNIILKSHGRPPWYT